MFNKEGIPFFVIMIPFFSILLIAFFGISYYLKVTDENFEKDLIEYRILYKKHNPNLDFFVFETEKRKELDKRREEFIYFVIILSSIILIFVIFFTILIRIIINDIIKKYVKQVQKREKELENLNKNLESEVQQGIKKAKEKDKAILRQSRLARLGSMLSMIAHQWRQPLTELSGVLMELETATRFKKVDNRHILCSIERSDRLIEFMSNTIDDFRNFYKPAKKKESFFIEDSCNKAYGLIDATLKNLGIEFILDVKKPSEAFGYPTDFSQVILNIIGNAKDILVERKIKNPKIYLTIDSENDKTIVTIRDNAGGINPEHFDTLFDPYFSTKDSGTGLGLYISKHIIEKNIEGELTVRNDKEGAVFKIVLTGKNHG